MFAHTVTHGLRIKLRENSFLFKENTQGRYGSASCGVLYVQKDRQYGLVDLADRSQQSLTPPQKSLAIGSKAVWGFPQLSFNNRKTLALSDFIDNLSDIFSGGVFID